VTAICWGSVLSNSSKSFRVFQSSRSSSSASGSTSSSGGGNYLGWPELEAWVDRASAHTPRHSSQRTPLEGSHVVKNGLKIPKKKLNPTLKFEKPNMASKIYNVGVIGYGLSAKVFHIPPIEVVPEFKLYAIVQRSPKSDDDAGKDHPGIKSYRSSEELFQDPKVDVVVVTTTPESHFELVKDALEAGKNVVIEKPFTPTSKEADELTSIAKKHNKLLTVYQNRRWDSDFLTLSKLIHSGALGRIVEFETHFDRFRPEAPTGTWKSKVIPGGGAIYDLGTHLLDQVVHLFGLPKKVTAFIGTQREHNTSGYGDSFTVLLHYDGMMATAKAAVVSPEINQLRYWVRGDKGSFKKFHLDCQEDQLKEGMKMNDQGFGMEPKDRYGVLTTASDGKFSSETVPTVEPATYAEFYRKFARALSGGMQVPVTPESASSVIRLIELAQESSKSGRTVDV